MAKAQKKILKTQENSFQENDSLVIVGIGASAGGLEAIQDFFAKMPSNTGLAFVVIQHLSPAHKSMMDELLAKYTKMKILVVKDGVKVQPNHIYLIPPAKKMTIFHGKLFLTGLDYKKGINLPIDIFFRSLAKDHGKNSVGVILSGTGSDGTLGIRAIKEAGGMVMVQDDRSAKFDGMPRSSIATGMVDYVLNPAQMPEKLLGYVQHPFINKTKDFKEELDQAEDALSKIIMLLREHCGVDFSYYKPNTIIRRIEKRLGINQVEKIDDYIDFLEKNTHEIDTLYNELLIGVTKFFRDKDAFDEISEKIIPAIFENKDEQSEIRVWCAGCSTGEEAYSLAMLFQDYMDQNKIFTDIKIFATDLDKNSIEFAGIGIYPENVYYDISPESLAKYFTKKDDHYQIKESIRRMVVFATQNITKDPPFSKIDLITCRNLLIYLNQETQRKILSMFYFSLKPSGYLFLGSSESVGEFSGFKSLNNKWRIFEYVQGYQPELNDALSLRLTSNKERLPTSRNVNVLKSYEKIFSDGLLNQVLESYLPPSVILDDQYNVIQIINDVNQFLKLPQGQLSYNILKLIKSDLSVMINSILRKAKKEEQQVTFENIVIDNEKEKKLFIDIKAGKFSDSRTKQTFFIISFVENNKTPLEVSTINKFDIKSQYHERLAELEKELQFTRENLQATVEELETSNEELQSSNEELVASNEELQSTNEELQSVNEELYTVNAEHQNKIQQLTEVNNDMDNLLKSTGIANIFLDKDLSIRKFTPKVLEIVSIMDMDVGRPIKHLSVGNIYKDFIKDIEFVQDSLKQFEKEISIKGNFWLVRILPYRTKNNAIDGIVISFVDINELKKEEQAKERERDLVLRILDNSPMAKTMVDCKGKIVFANKRAEEIFGFTNKQLKSKKFNDYDWQIKDENGKDIPAEKLPFSLIMQSKQNIYRFKHSITRPDNTQVLLSISGSPMFDEDREVSGAVFAIELVGNPVFDNKNQKK